MDIHSLLCFNVDVLHVDNSLVADLLHGVMEFAACCLPKLFGYGCNITVRLGVLKLAMPQNRRW